MKSFERKRAKDKVAISLMLCFCVVALVSVFAIKANLQKVNENAQSALASNQVKVQRNFSLGESADGPKAKTVTANASAKTSTAAKPKTVKSKSKFTSPFKEKATVYKDYSMDDIVYSITLDQYMTHSGIDLTSTSPKVYAIADGIVSYIGSDTGYGQTVEVDHGNGYFSRYCNLKKDLKVQLGDNVKQGDLIGQYGNSGLFENAEEGHLHLEILKDGKNINPAKHIDL